MSNILTAEKVCKTYLVNNREHQVLKNIDLTIRNGEFISVMGPSGSGKSTLLYNVSGMDRVSSGSVTINNTEISSLNEKELSLFRLNTMGFIFQQINLLKNLGIIDNIIISAFMNKKRKRGEIYSSALKLMKNTGIEELIDHDITQASGGQLQRAAICRALINEPGILFGDEPTGALNSKTTLEIMEIFRNINESGTTIMLVTHDIKVASQTERVLFMIDGKIEGEFLLGKVTDISGIKEREGKLSKWLFDMGW